MQHRTWCQTSDERFRQETARIPENKYKYHIKVYTDGFKKEDSGNKLIATDSLSTLIAAMDKRETKNPKTRIIRKLHG
jgi:hypothetical protein